MSEIAIGIDLGTSNSCVAVMRDGEVEVLANAYGEATTASVVAFREDGGINVGNAAKANIIHNPERTVHSSKRLIGRYFFSEEVKKAQAICSYKIVDAENHALRIQIDEEQFSLPEIAAMILSEMKSIAEARLGQPVTKPFDLLNAQRRQARARARPTDDAVDRDDRLAVSYQDNAGGKVLGGRVGHDDFLASA